MWCLIEARKKSLYDYQFLGQYLQGEEEDIGAEEYFDGREEEIIAVDETMVYSQVIKREIRLQVYDRADLKEKLSEYQLERDV